MNEFWKNFFAKHSKESRQQAKGTLEALAREEGEVEADEVQDTEVEAALDSTQNQKADAGSVAVQMTVDAAALQPLLDQIEALKAQVETLTQEREVEQEAKAAELKAEAEGWARAQVEAGRILPSIEAAYAQTYEKLATICNAAIDAGAEDQVCVDYDLLGLEGNTRWTLLGIFGKHVEGGASHGWVEEKAKEPADNKVTFNKTSASEPVLLPDGTRLLSQEEIEAIVAQANGKKPAAAR